MNKNEQTEKTKNIFSAYQEVIDKTFNSINQAVPRYHQAIANTQQDVLKMFESNTTSTIEVQKEIATKAGVATNVSEANLKVVQDTADGYIKMATIGNQMVLSTIDAAQQGVKAMAENAKALNELSRNTTRSWIAAFAVAN